MMMAKTTAQDQDISKDGSWEEWAGINQQILQKQQELMVLLAEKSQALMHKPMQQDPMNVQQSLMHYWTALIKNPEKAMAAQIEFMQKTAALQAYTLARLQGQKADPIISGDKNDRRFRDARWNDHPIFDHLRQSYLLTAQWWQDRVHDAEEIDPAAARKLKFVVRQYTDAMSPSNFWMTNPEVLDETIKSKGGNLLRGLDNMITDLRANKGLPKVSMAKKGAFEVGKNLANTSGKVVFQNQILQLIQYTPSTPKVYKTPLLIVSPWINKYYILDMQAENSFVKWAVDQGHTVFITSWANADASMRDLDWDDYMEKGLGAAIKAVQDATNEKEINVIGYCIGGTLLTTLLAYLKAKGEKSPVKSATFFTALIDFEDAGELTIFTDEAQIAGMEKMMAEKGYLDAWHLHTTFNMLRANDLIWSFVVNNYLLGREPFPFDLLYWNSDSTGIPAKLHSTYLRQMYLHNHLSRPGKLKVKGTGINVRQIDTPSYFVSTIEDHIAPWQATYTGAKLLSGDVTFTLAGSGHIAGVVNPPVKNKYNYWTNKKLPNSADEWLNAAKRFEGSWWPNWAEWIKKHSGTKVAARTPGKGKLKAIENAPGSYVKVRAL